MAIVAGIDEAGYGPVLGPLVVTGTVFEVPDELAGNSLWKVLRGSVTQRTSTKDGRLAIADSKKLYSSQAGLKALERAALVMLATWEKQAGSFRELIEALAPHALEPIQAYPWYGLFDAPLPSTCGERDIATRANAVRRNMEARGVRLVGVFCEPLLEGHFNRLVDSTRNKAVVLLGLAWRIVQRILTLAENRPATIHIDRQGGREHYGAQLMISFADYHLRIVEETENRSAYELSRIGARHTVDFVVGGEDRHLPVALASIYSKYVRELFMSAFNAWWGQHVTNLRPTAGYHTDGLRFLRDISGSVAGLGIDRAWLVRSR